MHTVVEQPLTSSSKGRILCQPIGQDPIQFDWVGPDGHTPELHANGSEAHNLVPGKYRVEVIDASGARADALITLEPMHSDAVVIHDYHVTPASTSHSRDGSVEIVGVGLEGWSFLWTNGVETKGATLRDVPCGVYAAIPCASRDKVPVLVHSCEPARVGVDTQGRWGA